MPHHKLQKNSLSFRTFSANGCWQNKGNINNSNTTHTRTHTRTQIMHTCNNTETGIQFSIICNERKRQFRQTFGTSQLRSADRSLILRSKAEDTESRGIISSPRNTVKMNFSQNRAPERLAHTKALLVLAQYTQWPVPRKWSYLCNPQ